MVVVIPIVIRARNGQLQIRVGVPGKVAVVRPGRVVSRTVIANNAVTQRRRLHQMLRRPSAN